MKEKEIKTVVKGDVVFSKIHGWGIIYEIVVGSIIRVKFNNEKVAFWGRGQFEEEFILSTVDYTIPGVEYIPIKARDLKNILIIGSDYSGKTELLNDIADMNGYFPQHVVYGAGSVDEFYTIREKAKMEGTHAVIAATADVTMESLPIKVHNDFLVVNMDFKKESMGMRNKRRVEKLKERVQKLEEEIRFLNFKVKKES